MKIGVPKEIKSNEHRVGVTPAAAVEYLANGHQVYVQSGAGEGIGVSDTGYLTIGATIVPEIEDVYDVADMVVKVKEPQPSEYGLLRKGQILYAYLHLAPDRAQTDALIASGATCIAYETITDSAGRLPLLAPMSEVAGRLSIHAAAHSMERHAGGHGILIGGVPGVAPAHVVVLGGGTVGTNAAKMAAGLGARVTILDSSLNRLRQLDDIFGGRIVTLFASAKAVADSVAKADVVIGSVLIPGAQAPKLITRKMLADIHPGTVLVDVAIDQGGCFETSRPTTHADPTYVEEGVIHYCVANMPGAVSRTSSHALGNATLPYGIRLANFGLDALRDDPHFAAGLNVHRGRLTNAPTAKAQKREAITVSSALAD